MKPNVSSDKANHPRKPDSPWRRVWRALSISRTVALILLLVLSLGANAALFVGGVLYNTIDQVLERVAGLETETSKQRKTTEELRQKNRQLDDRNRKLGANNRNLEKRMARLRTVTSAAVKRTVARSAIAVTRAAATAPAKALPYVGTTVVVGATALEIKGHCDTIRDMNEIRRRIDPSKSHTEDEQTVCGMDLPTPDEVWSQIRKEPLATWRHSREFLPDLGPIPLEIKARFNGLWENAENLIHGGWGGLHRMLRVPD